MAVGRHLGFHRTGNSVIRSTDPENPGLEPNMEWTGCTVCEIFAFKLYCDLKTEVRGYSRSSKAALFNKAHTNLYSSSIVNILSIYYRFQDIAAYWLKIATPPPCIQRPRWGWSRQIYTSTIGDQKLEWWAYQIVKEFWWCVQPFWYNPRVWQDRQTDGRTDGRILL